MKNAFRFFISGISILLLAGCKTSPTYGPPPPLTAEEREEIQTRVFSSDVSTVFAATINTLQSQEWDIQEVGKDSGVILATSRKWDSRVGPSEDWTAVLPGYSKKPVSEPGVAGASQKEPDLNQWTRWEKLTAHIETWEGGKTRARVSIIKFGTLPALTITRPAGSGYGRRDIITVSAPAKEDQASDENPLTYSKIFSRIADEISKKQTN